MAAVFSMRCKSRSCYRVWAGIAPLIFGLCMTFASRIQAQPKKDPFEWKDESKVPQKGDEERTPPNLEDGAHSKEGAQEEGDFDLKEVLWGTYKECEGVLLDWHRWLSGYMSPYVAWGVLSSPIWFSLIFFLIRAATGNGPAGVKKKKQQTLSRKESVLRPLIGEEKEPEAPPLELIPTEKLLTAAEQKRPSIYETFLILGANEDVLRSFRRIVAEDLEAVYWEAAIKDGRTDLLRSLRAKWVKDLAVKRVVAWLSEHPHVTHAGLKVNAPPAYDVSELDSLTLTQPDGLGAQISANQLVLLKQARTGLAQVFQAAENPYTLFLVAQACKISALSGFKNDGDREPYPLALLFTGLKALSHGTTVQLNTAQHAQEFSQAIEEHHRLVKTDVPGEGCVVHALYRTAGVSLPGIGSLLASAAGAAFSPASVVISVSKQVNALSHDQQNAIARLGAAFLEAFGKKEGSDCKAILANLRRLLGVELLEAEGQRVHALGRLTERLSSKEPLWQSKSTPVPPPDLALVKLHQKMVEHLRRQAPLVERRILEIWDKLAFAGSKADNLQNAHCRIGYVVVGLGMNLLHSTSTDLLSIGREAASKLSSR